MTRWKKIIKSVSRTGAFFLETILEIPPTHINNIVFDSQEMGELLEKYGDDITEEAFTVAATKVAEGNALDGQDLTPANRDEYDSSSAMFNDQKIAYEEAVSLIVDELYRIRQEVDPEPEPKPEPKHKNRMQPDTGDWRKNLRIIQRKRRKKKASLGSSRRTRRAGGKSKYGGALTGMAGRAIPGGPRWRTFNCSQCGHTRSARLEKKSDSGESICEYCFTSNERTKRKNIPADGSGGSGGFTPSTYRQPTKHDNRWPRKT